MLGLEVKPLDTDIIPKAVAGPLYVVMVIIDMQPGAAASVVFF